MHKLLLRNMDSMPNSQLDEVFAAVFNLDPLPYSSGAHTQVILDLILDHAIKLELDKTVVKGGNHIWVGLTPRTTRKRFEELRILYYQGLQIDFNTAGNTVFMECNVISRTGKDLDPTLMKALLTFAYKDAFRGGGN